MACPGAVCGSRGEALTSLVLVPLLRSGKGWGKAAAGGYPERLGMAEGTAAS